MLQNMIKYFLMLQDMIKHILRLQNMIKHKSWLGIYWCYKTCLWSSSSLTSASSSSAIIVFCFWKNVDNFLQTPAMGRAWHRMTFQPTYPLFVWPVHKPTQSTAKLLLNLQKSSQVVAKRSGKVSGLRPTCSNERPYHYISINSQ